MNISVSTIIPIAGPAGGILTVRGSNFGTDASEMSIRFGTMEVQAYSMSDTELKIRVPLELPNGPTTLYLKRGTGREASITYTVQDPIVGTWVSEDENVAPLLYGPPFNIRKIVATYNPNNGFLFIQTDSNNVSVTFTGTFATKVGEAPAPNERIKLVTIQQSVPVPMTAEGIYEVTLVGDELSMQYEVAQTEPPIDGVSKPTPEAGFGSTSGGIHGTINVQKYIKR